MCTNDSDISDETTQNTVPLLKDGLPLQAFAIVEDTENPSTWYLPHHTPRISLAVRGEESFEHSVDWTLMAKANVLLFNGDICGNYVAKGPQLIFDAACHLAHHYHKARREIPQALSILLLLYELPERLK